MITISVNKVEKDIPVTWQEVKPDQLLKILKWISEGVNGIQLKLKFLELYFKLPITKLDKLGKAAEKIEDLRAWEHYQECMSKLLMLSYTVNFLDKTPEVVNRIGLRLRLGFGKYFYAPAEGFKNLEIWEFVLAEQAFKNDEYNKLIAILFRKKKYLHFIQKHLSNYNNDIRCQFNDIDISKNEVRIAKSKITEEVKLAIVIWFGNFLSTLPLTFPHVYLKVNTKKQKTNSKGQSWGDIIINMSGEIPGNEDKVARVNLNTLLYRLEMNAVKYEKWKIDNKIK